MPNIGDKITGTVKGYVGTVIGAESYRLDDVEVVEPAIPKDDYPLGTVVESQGRDFVKMTRPDCRVRWYQTGSEDGLSGHNLDWRSIARDHVVKYRPDREPAFTKCLGYSVTEWRDFQNDMIARTGSTSPDVWGRFLVREFQHAKDALAESEAERQSLERALATRMARCWPHRTVTTEAEYAALPEGSIVLEDRYDTEYGYTKQHDGWQHKSVTVLDSPGMAGITRKVLREGWTA